MSAPENHYRTWLDADRRTERALMWRELLALAIVIGIVAARLQWGD